MFAEIYKDSRLQSMSAQATQSLVQMLLVDNIRGQDKLQEITAMDMESTFNKTVYPSMMYTFLYDSPDVEQINNRTFKDHIPVILCMSFDGNYITGLNFNLIPNDIRADILDIIYNAFTSFYKDKLSNAVTSGTAVLNEQFASILINERSRTDFLHILNAKLGMDVSNAYRTYSIKYIKNIRLIEYDNWKYIPFLSFTDSVRGAGLASLQKEMVDKHRNI